MQISSSTNTVRTVIFKLVHKSSKVARAQRGGGGGGSHTRWSARIINGVQRTAKSFIFFLGQLSWNGISALLERGGGEKATSLQEVVTAAGNFSSGRAKRLYGTHAQPSARAFDLNYFSLLSSHPFIIPSTFPHLENHVSRWIDALSLSLVLFSFFSFNFSKPEVAPLPRDLEFYSVLLRVKSS